MDFEQLKSLIKGNTKVICINQPNNPTGFIFTREEMMELVEIAKEHNIYLLCDEVYKGLELDDIKRPWFCDLYNKAITIGVMSKAYGLPGLRIGWTCCKDSIINEKLIKMKHYTTICNSGPSEFLATLALKHSEFLLDKNKEIIIKNIKLSDDFFHKFSHLFKPNQPKAGPIGYHRVTIEEVLDDFILTMIEEVGVLLLSSSVYHMEAKYIRMGYGRKNFAENLKVLEHYLDSKY